MIARWRHSQITKEDLCLNPTLVSKSSIITKAKKTYLFRIDSVNEISVSSCYKDKDEGHIERVKEREIEIDR